MNRRGFLTGAAAVSVGLLAHQSASATSFPSRPLRIVVPTGGSAPPDIVQRIIANALSRDEGWKVLVENKPGGAMTIGAEAVLREPADGYTLLAATPPLTAIPGLIPHAPFNAGADFSPVIEVGTGYNVLVVGPQLPVHSAAELVAYLKKAPGKYTFSSGGFGRPAHLLGEMFMLATGTKAVHVPYTHTQQAIADLVSGVNAYQFISLLPVVQLIKAGKLRALAVMGKKRLAVLPDVPTIGEAGYPDLEAEDWNGLLVKTGTPSEVIGCLNQAVNRALQTEAVRASFAKLGVDVGGGTPQQLGELYKSEIARWTKVIRDADIKID